MLYRFMQCNYFHWKSFVWDDSCQLMHTIVSARKGRFVGIKCQSYLLLAVTDSSSLPRFIIIALIFLSNLLLEFKQKSTICSSKQNKKLWSREFKLNFLLSSKTQVILHIVQILIEIVWTNPPGHSFAPKTVSFIKIGFHDWLNSAWSQNFQTV